MFLHAKMKACRSTTGAASRLAGRCSALLLGVALAGGCGHPGTNSAPRPADIVETIFLIGDAGEPDPRLASMVLDSLHAQAASVGTKGTILFLGDNVYPAGVSAPLVAPLVGSYPDAVRRLDAQIRVVPTNGRGIFLPGNHDWADGGGGGVLGSAGASDGLYTIRREGELVERRPKNPNATVFMAPRNGCPGPTVIDSPRVRLILLDTQWWLQNYIVRDSISDDPETGCANHTIPEIVQAVKDSLRATKPGQSVIVAGHHPLRTAGQHGGYCGAFALFKRWANSNQDLFGKNYKLMRASLNEALATHPPLIFAAGHDHSLQVLRGKTSRYVLVSGAGSLGKGECAARLRETIYVAQATSGFMRLDFSAGDSVRLGVYRYDSQIHGEVFSQWLHDAR